MIKLEKGVNDLATTHPHLLSEWDYEKNGTLSPDMITAGSQKKVWWICKKKHTWQVAPYLRKIGNGCPYCSGHRVWPGYNDLTTTHPSLSLEWHPTKNNIKPEMVSAGSNQEFWWKCQFGHEWKKSVNARTRGLNCPICSNHKVLKGFNDLATVAPELAKEWNYTKNGNLTPEMVSKGYDQKVWWLCEKGHEYQSRIPSRRQGRGCPVCANRRVISGYNDIVTLFPKLMEEWNSEKNGSLDPKSVGRGSHKKIWWKCSRGHEWQSTTGDRLRGQGCPVCANKVVVAGFNDLVTTNPQLAAEWDFENNGILKPEHYTKGSTQVVWWTCKFGHRWQAPIYSRNNGRGCPTCAKGLQTSFAEQAIFFYVKRLYPDAVNGTRHLGKELDIYIPSIKTAIEYDGYMWHSTPEDTQNDFQKNDLCKQNNITLYRIREEGCSAMTEEDFLKIIPCAYKDETRLSYAIRELLALLGNDISVDIDSDRLKITEQFAVARTGNSLPTMNPELAKEFHPTKNGTLSPEAINYGSGMKIWWLCKNGHAWQAYVNNRYKGSGCPYCSNQKVLAGFNDLSTTNPELASEWNYEKNGHLQPTDVVSGSNKKVWWKCKYCAYEWQAMVITRNKGHGCAQCARNRRK